MKYKRIYLFLLMFTISFTATTKAQSEIEWFKFYSAPDFRNTPHASCVDNQGNVYMTGETIDYSEDQYEDILTVKYDKNGNLKWVSSVNDDCDENDVGYAVTADEEGNVYVAGLLSNCSNLDDYVIIKYDSNGNILWQTTYNSPLYNNVMPFNDEAAYIVVDDDGNVYVSGICRQFDELTSYVHRDIGTAKLDRNGNLLWADLFNTAGNGDDTPTGISVNKFGDVFVVGYRWSQNNTDDADLLVLMYDKNGNLKWSDRYDGPLNGGDYGTALANDDFGNVYVGGTQDKLINDSNADMYIVKYDTNGTKLWTDVIDNNIPGVGGRYDEPTDMLVDGNGNLIIAGDDSGFRACLMKYSLDGQQIWKTFWTPSDLAYENSGLCIDQYGNIYVSGQTALGDYPDEVSVLAGAEFGPNGNLKAEAFFDKGIYNDENCTNRIIGCGIDGENAFYLTGDNFYGPDIAFSAVKLNLVTAVNTDERTVAQFKLEQNYPNPFSKITGDNPTTIITFSIPEREFVSLTVYNILGEETAKLINSELPAGNHQVPFNAANLPTGTYFYQLRAGGFVQTKKCILVK